MTAIKHALQRDIFTPNDERLLSIVNVCKAGKKKKNCFLCATGKALTHTTDPSQSMSSCIRLLFIWCLFVVFSDYRASSAGEGGQSEEVG